MAEKKSVFERIRDLRLTINTQTEVASLLTMLIGGKLGASVDELAALSDMLTESFYDFNFYAGTGSGAFSHSGMSVQERYLVIQEERRTRAEQRRAEKQAKQQNAVDIATQRAEERLAAMTPEEKQMLLAAYGYA